MKVLLVERINPANQYIEELQNAYQNAGHEVLLDVQNFLFSNFLPDFVHLEWPEAIYRWRHDLSKESADVLISERLKFYKSRGVPLVYTVHNLLPHENIKRIDQDIYRIIINHVDIFVHHGHNSINILKDTFPICQKAIHLIAPHGPYPFIEADSVAARKKYSLPKSKIVYLNFGRMRENKGLYFTPTVFKSWENNNTILFTIGPKRLPWLKRKLYKVSNKIQKSFNLRFETKFKTINREIDHREIPEIFSSVDALFLGHLQGLNSGILALAVSYKKPVVFPDIGNFEEQLEFWPWKVKYKAGDRKSAICALEKMNSIILNKGKANFSNDKWLEKNSWQKHVMTIVSEVEKFKHKYQKI